MGRSQHFLVPDLSSFLFPSPSLLRSGPLIYIYLAVDGVTVRLIVAPGNGSLMVTNVVLVVLLLLGVVVISFAIY